jgi:hypothetical protein
MDVEVLVGKREERRQLGREGVDGGITLKLMLKEQMVRAFTWFIRTGAETRRSVANAAIYCKHSDSLKLFDYR